ncbi:MAG: hypothetical protein ACFB02_10390 [Mastigocoleus sp.]
MLQKIEQLYTQWYELISTFQAEPIKTQHTFAALVSNYSNQKRFYHNLEHISHVLRIIETLQDYAQNLASVKFAAWFHDVVYNTKTHDNEEKSAIYAVNTLKSLGISDQVTIKVKHLILSTKTHHIDVFDPEKTDTQILLDADLAILGSQPEKYQKYTQSIRQEYGWVSNDNYCVARKRVLEKFLQRRYIYSTPLMYQKYEQTARKNIRAEIEYFSILEL